VLEIGQGFEAQMIRHMRHGSSPRLMALQPIRVLDLGESLTGPISRSSYYTQADRATQGGGLAAEHENVTPVEVSLADLARMADAGQLVDMKTMLLVQTLRLRRPTLFSEDAS
jgi:hypothetical protein